MGMGVSPSTVAVTMAETKSASRSLSVWSVKVLYSFECLERKQQDRSWTVTLTGFDHDRKTINREFTTQSAGDRN